MPTAEKNIAIRDPIFRDEYAGTDVSDVDILASTASEKETLAEGWYAIIDHPLIEWSQRCDDFELEGLVGPSGKAISKAGKLVSYMRSQEWPLPTGIIADGEGGIVFENKQDPIYQRIEIDERGLMMFVTFRDCKLQEQLNIDIE